MKEKILRLIEEILQVPEGRVTENTLIVIETSLRADLSFLENTGFSVEKEKRYKTNRHVFCRKM